MLTRTQALEGGANVTCISKVQFTYHSTHPVNHFGPLRYNISIRQATLPRVN